MDLSQLQAALAGLGPWGVVIGIAITLFVQRMKSKPATAETPLLDAVLNLLKVKHTSTPVAPVKQDIDHETAAELLGGVVIGKTEKK